jgi:hypothetical protein
MNDRIDKLIEQCTRQNFSDCIGGFETFDKEKFAKLIVQECQFAIVSRTDLPRHERKLYNNVLKEHFGVEE